MIDRNSASVLVCVWTFGAFCVERRTKDGTWESVSLDAWGGNTHSRRLLKLLLCTDRRARRGTILEELWPRNESMLAEEYLNKAASNVRRVLHTEEHDPFLKTINNRTTYELTDQSRLWVDADACETLMKEAERIGHTSAKGLELLKVAIEYFERGRFLEGEDGLWCHGKRGMLDTARYRCTLWIAEAYEEQGEFKQAEEQVERLLKEDPTDEDMLCRLMLLLHKQGMTAEALRRYKQTKSFLERQGEHLTETTNAFAERLRNQPPTIKAEHITRQLRSSIPNERLVVSSREETIDSHEVTKTDTIVWNIRPDSHGLLHAQTAEILPALVKLSNINRETLDLFERLAEICWHLSKGNEIMVAEQVLGAYLPKIVTLTLLPSQHQQEAAKIVSQSYLLAASLAGHRNNLQARQHFSEQALVFGNLAQERNLQVAALRQLAITFDRQKQLTKVLRTYQQTFPYLNEVSPFLRACIYAGVSGTYAQLQQQQEAHRFLGLAYEHFPENPEGEPGFLQIVCGYTTLILCDGLSRLDFNQPLEAEKVFAQIDGLQPKAQVSEKIRIELLNCQAETFTLLGNMEQAHVYLEAAAKASIVLGSKRLYKESFDVYKQMWTTWPNEQPVKVLGDLFIEQNALNHQ